MVFFVKKSFFVYPHTPGLAQNGDRSYQCKDSNPIFVVLEGPHRSVGRTRNPMHLKRRTPKSYLSQSCTRRATRILQRRRMPAGSHGVTGKFLPCMVGRWPIDLETIVFTKGFPAQNLLLKKGGSDSSWGWDGWRLCLHIGSQVQTESEKVAGI